MPQQRTAHRYSMQSVASLEVAIIHCMVSSGRIPTCTPGSAHHMEDHGSKPPIPAYPTKVIVESAAANSPSISSDIFAQGGASGDLATFGTFGTVPIECYVPYCVFQLNYTVNQRDMGDDTHAETLSVSAAIVCLVCECSTRFHEPS
jgi:hypothetical protein